MQRVILLPVYTYMVRYDIMYAYGHSPPSQTHTAYTSLFLVDIGLFGGVPTHTHTHTRPHALSIPLSLSLSLSLSVFPSL